jgi:predicted Zn-dependent protease
MDAVQEPAERRAPASRLTRFAFLLGLAAAMAALISFAGVHLARSRPRAAAARLAVFSAPEGLQQLLSISEEQPHDAEWQVRLGQEFLRQGHYLSAIAALERGLQMGAPEAPIRWGLTAAHEALDQPDQALIHLDRLRLLQPKSLSVPLRQALVLDRLDRPREARRVLDGIPRDHEGAPTLLDPEGRSGALERLGLAYGLQGHWKESLAIGRRLLRESPPRLGALVMVGQALMATQQPLRAEPYFRAALARAPDRLELKYSLARILETQGPSHDDELVKLLEQIVNAGAPSGDVLYSLAQLHERRGRWAWAAAYYSGAARMGIRPRAAQQSAYRNELRAGRREQALFLKGRDLEQTSDLAAAARVYQELISLRPKSDAGYRHLARVRIAQGDTEGAIRLLRRAATLPAPNPRVFLRLALAYQKLGNHQAKEEAWAEFRKRSPEEAYLVDANEATAADTAGRLDEAEERLRRCIQAQPRAVQYQIRLGQLLIERRADPGRLREARDLLEVAVAEARSDVEAHLALGTAYRYSGLRREAVWALRHAIDLEPGNGRPYQILGETLIEAGQKEEGSEMLALFKRFRQYTQALDVLSLRLKRNPRDTNVARRLAAIQERSGAFADAARTYAGILAVNPRDEAARVRLAEVQARLGLDDSDDARRTGDVPLPGRVQE